ncbi:MAG: iron-sulfur cluster assembly protein [Polyangiaceae bacterium]|jgi:FeS assembly SUF system protein|nr:iron-sulfur cluster assembly protein [Polyangiaceae bacterium]
MKEDRKDDVRQVRKEDIIDVLRNCYDPEIPVNIYELGLVYGVLVTEDGEVSVSMTLTAPACPVADILPREIEERLYNVPGVRRAKVELIWEPPWSPERMSEAARLQLGML